MLASSRKSYSKLCTFQTVIIESDKSTNVPISDLKKASQIRGGYDAHPLIMLQNQ
jgi:hypothetical protein